jgi:hypothetical protein
VADEIDAWLGDQRAQAAADARTRERWLRQQASDSATFAGLLADLAERGTAVVVALANGRRHQGTLAAIGADFATLAAEAGHTVLVSLAAVTSVRPAGAAAGATAGLGGTTARAGSGRLVHALADAAVDRPRVLLGLGGGEMVSGDLQSVGQDVVTLRNDGTAPVYVRLGSIYDASLFGSG